MRVLQKAFTYERKRKEQVCEKKKNNDAINIKKKRKTKEKMRKTKDKQTIVFLTFIPKSPFVLFLRLIYNHRFLLRLCLSNVNKRKN